METNRIRQFCAVYELGNLRKAADVLNVSHSALSKSLQVFQHEIGVQLLMPEGRGIVPTDQGVEYYPRFKRFLQEEEALFRARQPASSILRIGTFEVFSTHLLGSVWTQYFGGDSLELHELLPGRIEAALVQQRIDLGITYEPIPTAGLTFRRLGRVRMGIFARVGAFLGLRTEELPFVAPRTVLEETPSGARGLDGWPDGKVPRNVLHWVDMLESGLSLARTGTCAIFIPIFVAEQANRCLREAEHLTERALPAGMKPVLRNIYIAKRKSTLESSVEKRLAKLLRLECLHDGKSRPQPRPPRR